jgi:DNA-binding transcriptional LysR family regulator
MAFETRHIQYFIAVAEELHFRRAAERLHLTQPALSRAIKQLEHTVGTELLSRTNRRVQLTSAGIVFLEGCRQSMKNIERAADQALLAREGKVGHLYIAYTDNAIAGIFPEIIERFRRVVPGVSLDLDHSFTEGQYQKFEKNEIDIGFLTGPVTLSGYDQITVQQESLVVVLPEDHPCVTADEVYLADLAEFPFVTGMQQVWKYFFKHIDPIFEKAGYRPSIIQEAFNSEGIIGLVAAKMGVAILPKSTQNYFRRGVVIRPLADDHPLLSTVAAWNTQSVSPAMASFIEILQEFRME